MCKRFGSVQKRFNPDVVVAAELQRAGIPVVPKGDPHPACPLRVRGRLDTPNGPIYLNRRSHYYEAAGPVPLDKAKALYYEGGDAGKREVRAGGHRRALPPEQFAVPDLPDPEALADLHRLGYLMKPLADVDEDAAPWDSAKDPWDALDWSTWPSFERLADLCNVGKVRGARFVGTYHLDSQEALNQFAATLRG